MQRGKYTAELAKQLRDAGIEAYSSADAALYKQCHPKKKLPGKVMDKGKGIIVIYEMVDEDDKTSKEMWYFVYKPSKQANSGYATKYEGNLIYAINIAGGQPEATANALAGSRNEDIADQASADDIISAIKWGDKPTKAQRASGGALPAVKLTPLYKKYIKSTEPKTDIFVWFGKDRKNASVKSATGAQYASAQGPEAVAIFEAALKGVSDAEKRDYYKTVEKILNKFGGRATGTGTATMEPMREQYAEETGLAKQALDGVVSDIILGDCSAEECRQKADELLALAKNPKAVEKVIANQKKVLDEKSDAVKKESLINMQKDLNEAMPQIDAATQQWMNTPEARQLILREAVTGENKFATKEAIANAVLKWDDSEFSKSSWALLDDKWFSAHVGKTKYNFRSRGGAGLANRGIAFRLDALNEHKSSTTLLSSAENQELSLLWEAMVLTEGPWSDGLAKIKQKAQQFTSTIADKLKQLGAEGKKIYNAIKEVAAKAWKNIKEYAMKLYESGVQFVKDSVKKIQNKIMVLVKDFGVMFPTLFEVSSTVIQVGEGADAATPEMSVNEHLTSPLLSYTMLSEMIENFMGEE